MRQYVYEFSEGSREMADLLGGKGANLAEMTRLGLPVPPGFTVTTQACRAFLATGAEPDGARRCRSRGHSRTLEQARRPAAGRAATTRCCCPSAPGAVLHARHDGDDPRHRPERRIRTRTRQGLRAGALRLGLLPPAAADVRQHGAWASTRQLFEDALARLKADRGAASDTGLDAHDLAELVDEFKKLIREETGEDFPQSPAEQLLRAVLAVFDSWNGERARLYRRREHIPDDLGTAVNVQTMVFGNLGPDSGSGVAFTRDPATGQPGLYGDYLANAQGEDVVAGIRNTVPLTELKRLDPASYRQLARPHADPGDATTGTCATSSSPSSAARCGCCRPGSASAPPRPRSPSPPSWSTRG